MSACSTPNSSLFLSSFPSLLQFLNSFSLPTFSFPSSSSIPSFSSISLSIPLCRATCFLWWSTWMEEISCSTSKSHTNSNYPGQGTLNKTWYILSCLVCHTVIHYLQVLCCRDSVWTAIPSLQWNHLPVRLSIFETVTGFYIYSLKF